jgi:transposase
MTEDRNIAKRVRDQGWYQFKQMLDYKLKCSGAELIEIGRFEQSTKMWKHES